MSLKILTSSLVRKQARPVLAFGTAVRSNSSLSADAKKAQDTSTQSADRTSSEPSKKRKSQAEIDEELRQKMAGLSGDGGESGVEYENGQPVAMKRGVKDNMFRYI